MKLHKQPVQEFYVSWYTWQFCRQPLGRGHRSAAEGAGLLVLCYQAGAGRARHAVVAGMEEDAGWLVQADDACLIISLVTRLAGCNCPGNC